MEIVTHLLKLGIIINDCSHWVLAPEDPCTIDHPSSNNLEIPDKHSRLFAVDRAPLDYILFVDFIQEIQITQFHNTEICGTVNGLVAGNQVVSHRLEVVQQWC
jgi:hypothetical protein